MGLQGFGRVVCCGRFGVLDLESGDGSLMSLALAGAFSRLREELIPEYILYKMPDLE